MSKSDTRGKRAALFLALAFLATACRTHPGRPSPEYAVSDHRATPVLAALRDSVRSVLDRALADSAFPGAIAIVGDSEGELVELAVGALDWPPGPPPDRHTLWDLASLTKVVATTTAMMRLVDRGLVDVDAPVQRYLPAWVGPGKELVTVRHLLTHSSGLPSFRAYDQTTHDPDSLADLMFQTALDTMPGERMVYSDIGAYMVGRIVEAVGGATLDRVAAREVFGPMGLRDVMFNPPDSLRYRIAPTEVDPRRGGLVHGKVHDERAYYLRGVSAHAGLFGSASDLSSFAQTMLRGGRLGGLAGEQFVTETTLRSFTAYADPAFSNRGLGWQKVALPGTRFAAPAPAWGGSRMSPESFGHTGFTGTSIAIDPASNVYIVLLSNRVNPTRNNNRIGAVRTQLADAVLAAVGAGPRQ